jgi:hypothetical protein
LFPGPGVHSDLTAATALTTADEDRAPAGVEVSFAERERFVERNPARQSTTISPRIRKPWGVAPAWRITATISSTVGGSAG